MRIVRQPGPLGTRPSTLDLDKDVDAFRLARSPSFYAQEDARLHGRIDIPGATTASGRPIAVLVSNFGGQCRHTSQRRPLCATKFMTPD